MAYIYLIKATIPSTTDSEWFKYTRRNLKLLRTWALENQIDEKWQYVIVKTTDENLNHTDHEESECLQSNHPMFNLFNHQITVGVEIEIGI